ncbi:MAG: flagellar hook-associated protein FlgK [Deferribacteraceae bacterium]|jgi:flagellar hook-associated protein 1 FlgK|nr:flagellar hook-associated protein FlgK [Deferribacteraceae bacterium]
MSNLFAMMNTGVSGANAAQVAIDVTGHNIANIKNENYSRQRVNVSSVTTSREMNGAFGRGVKVTEIIRVYDDLVAKTLRTENSSLSYWQASQDTLSEIGTYFNETENGSGLGQAIQNYFDSWQTLGNTPPDDSDQSHINRRDVATQAEQLATQIRDDYAMLKELRSKLDVKIEAAVNRITDLSRSLAELNSRIVATEATGNNANDLRDTRDQYANEIATLVGANVVERENGEYAVYVAGSPIVDGPNSYPMTTVHDKGNSDHLDVVWSSGEYYSDNVTLNDRLVGGALQAYIEMRDEVIPGYQNQLDEMAATLIYETNKLHVSGKGLEKFSQLTSTNVVDNPEYNLDSKEGSLKFPVKEGTFQIKVYDEEGNVAETYDIKVDPSEDNLYGVAEKISLADGSASGGRIQATVNNDGTIKITVTEGYTFSFGEDTSDFLTATGLNNFFSGTGAEDIFVEDRIIENPDYISASADGEKGEGKVAKAIANLKFADAAKGKSITIEEFYGVFAGGIAITQEQTGIFLAGKAMTVQNFSEKLEQVKGVSMEEEQSNLAMFQRVFEANSRYITVIDEMLNLIINNLGLVGR